MNPLDRSTPAPGTTPDALVVPDSFTPVPDDRGLVGMPVEVRQRQTTSDTASEVVIGSTRGPVATSPGFLRSLAAAYREAFAGEPWNEVSRCVSPDKPVNEQCSGGFSALPVGELCRICDDTPLAEAYPFAELEARLADDLARSDTFAYWERDADGAVMVAAIFRLADPIDIAEARYADQPGMQLWFARELGSEPILWLDEIFADRAARPAGNLWNLETAFTDAATAFGVDRVAFRSINERLLGKAASVLDDAQVLDGTALPDERNRSVVVGRARMASEGDQS